MYETAISRVGTFGIVDELRPVRKIRDELVDWLEDALDCFRRCDCEYCLDHACTKASYVILLVRVWRLEE